VDLLQQDSAFDTIRLLVRRPVKFQHPKLEIKLVNFDDHESFKLALDGCEVVFCAVGTTQKKVKGNQAAYRKVDYDIPVNAARFCAETGGKHFLLVSSVGANSQSGNFYLKLKGEVENAVIRQPLECISIFRPSMLLGDRQESRPAEKVGQVVMKTFSFLLWGKRSKYKPIEARDVASAMVNAAKTHHDGIFLHEYNRIMLLSR
jgi:uncharacterized protein YbjT (DUF2867 family)